MLKEIEEYTPKDHKADKQWIPELGLKQSDREVICQDSWLTDNIINAAQTLLKRANPAVPGMQDVGCGLTMNFDIQPGEFVQILHTGQGHWNTVSTIGTNHPEVQIFESMFVSLGKAQIAALLATEENIIVKFMDVQMLYGECDCGLFSICFATALVFGEQPGHILFDQKKIRSHLMHCFEQKKISMFPIRKRRRICSKVKYIKIFLFTVSAECQNCLTQNRLNAHFAKKYHSETCVTVAPHHLYTKSVWYCPKCHVD